MISLGWILTSELQSCSIHENNNSGLSFSKFEYVWDKVSKLQSVWMIGTSLSWEFAELEPWISSRALTIKMYLSCWLKADLMLYTLGRNTHYLYSSNKWRALELLKDPTWRVGCIMYLFFIEESNKHARSNGSTDLIIFSIFYNPNIFGDWKSKLLCILKIKVNTCQSPG